MEGGFWDDPATHFISPLSFLCFPAQVCWKFHSFSLHSIVYHKNWLFPLKVNRENLILSLNSDPWKRGLEMHFSQKWKHVLSVKRASSEIRVAFCGTLLSGFKSHMILRLGLFCGALFFCRNQVVLRSGLPERQGDLRKALKNTFWDVTAAAPWSETDLFWYSCQALVVPSVNCDS